MARRVQGSVPGHLGGPGRGLGIREQRVGGTLLEILACAAHAVDDGAARGGLGLRGGGSLGVEGTGPGRLQVGDGAVGLGLQLGDGRLGGVKVVHKSVTNGILLNLVVRKHRVRQLLQMLLIFHGLLMRAHSLHFESLLFGFDAILFFHMVHFDLGLLQLILLLRILLAEGAFAHILVFKMRSRRTPPGAGHESSRCMRLRSVLGSK
mmetsp:Transcript_83838/g.224285  ORF Transcript_83838/g.224285 Transcript_83838/m.224285 type:complete len:207 (+) Transcript_83838:226-846(+)